MKKLLFLLFIFSSQAIRAQTSKIVFNGQTKGRETVIGELSLDKILVSKKTDIEHLTFDSLSSGYYSLKVRMNSQKSISYDSLYLGKDSIIYLSYEGRIRYQYKFEKEPPCKTRYCKDNQSEVKVGYASGDAGSSTRLSHIETSFGTKTNYIESDNEKWHLGALYGIYMDYTDLDVDIVNSDRIAYYNAGLEIGGQATWSGIQKHPCKCRYPFITVGATYKLPFFSRLTLINGNFKTFERYQHSLTNVSGYIQVGYRPVSIYVQYRPFNALNSDLSQPPELSTGLKFNF